MGRQGSQFITSLHPMKLSVALVTRIAAAAVDAAVADLVVL